MVEDNLETESEDDLLINCGIVSFMPEKYDLLNIGFVLSQLCVLAIKMTSFESLLPAWANCATPLSFPFDSLLKWNPSIMSKLLETIALDFLHLHTLFGIFLLREAPFLLVLPRLLEFLIAPSLSFHFFFHLSLNFLLFEESYFIFLKNLACKACSDTFSEFLRFILNSWTSSDAYNYSNFISYKYLDSSMATTMWSNLERITLRTFSIFCSSNIFSPHNFIWLIKIMSSVLIKS